jgi:ribonuclease D
VPAFYINAYATASDQKIQSPHPLLHKKLRELRNKICEQKNVPVYYVAGTTTIDEMATYLPQNLDEIVKISGFGQAKAKQYGHVFLKVINDYCAEHNLSSSVNIKQPKKRAQRKNSERRKRRIQKPSVINCIKKVILLLILQDCATLPFQPLNRILLFIYNAE